MPNKQITLQPVGGVCAHIRPFHEWTEIAEYLEKAGKCARLCRGIRQFAVMMEPDQTAIMILREDEDEIIATLQAGNDLGIDEEEIENEKEKPAKEGGGP